MWDLHGRCPHESVVQCPANSSRRSTTTIMIKCRIHIDQYMIRRRCNPDMRTRKPDYRLLLHNRVDTLELRQKLDDKGMGVMVTLENLLMDHLTPRIPDSP